MGAITMCGALDGFPFPSSKTPGPHLARTSMDTHEAFLNNHPVVKNLRLQAGFSESRPYSQILWTSHAQNLISGTLIGPGRVEGGPCAWTQAEGKSYVQICYVGSRLCRYPGIVHGGFLATMMDECFAMCCSAAVPRTVMMTANLRIDYKVPTCAQQYIVLRVKVSELEGRKAQLEGVIETLASAGETPTVLATASALFVSPRHDMVSLYVQPRGELVPTKPR
jgi:3'-phosphoadenosine 5'-phosphosulfate synthase